MSIATSKLARVLCLVTATSLVACTSTGTAYLAAPDAELVARGPRIMLRDERGRDLPVSPESTLTFHTRSGDDVTPVQAKLLCRTESAITVRESASDSCDGAPVLVAFDDITSVTVETFDRAGTTVIVAGIAVVVVVAIIAVAAATGDKNKSQSSSSGSSAGGGSGGAAPSNRPRPSAPPSDAPEHGGGMHVHNRGNAGAMARVTTEIALSTVNTEGGDAIPAPPEPPRFGPLFSDGASRRSTVSVLVGGDGGASAFTPHEGTTARVRGGVRLYDFVDLAIGARFLAGGSASETARALPTVGLGLHGELPRARWFAFGLEFEAGASGALDLYAAGRFGVRFAPIHGLWFGVYPIHPAYASWSQDRGKHWTALSSLDVAFTF